jgi:hypothetical protein
MAQVIPTVSDMERKVFDSGADIVAAVNKMEAFLDELA